MTLSEESGIGYRKMHLTPVFFARILHSTSYFFIIVFPTAFYDRSRMTGRYLILVCKNRFLVLLILIFILLCLLILAPFVNLTVDTLAKGKASHSLLQRRFAPRKVVRLLPVIRGRLTFRIFSFVTTTM